MPQCHNSHSKSPLHHQCNSGQLSNTTWASHDPWQSMRAAVLLQQRHNKQAYKQIKHTNEWNTSMKQLWQMFLEAWLLLKLRLLHFTNIIAFCGKFFWHQDRSEQTPQDIFSLFLTLHRCTLADNCWDSSVMIFSAVMSSLVQCNAMQCNEVIIF